jgi:hypothetical protein
MVNLPGRVEDQLLHELPHTGPVVLTQIRAIIALQIDEVYAMYSPQQLPSTTPLTTPGDSMFAFTEISFPNPTRASGDSQQTMMLQSPLQLSAPASFNTPDRMRRPSVSSFSLPTPQSEASRQPSGESLEYPWNELWNDQAMNSLEPVVNLLNVTNYSHKQDQNQNKEQGTGGHLSSLQGR